MSDSKTLTRNMFWLRDPANPVLPPQPDSAYDCGCCMNPWAVRVGDELRLYYAGADADGHRRICLATAPATAPFDPGPDSWTRHGPVLEPGPAGAFDHSWTVLPHVVKFADRWHMYYTGNCGEGPGLSAFPGIGLAVSDDGLAWTKHDTNPVLAPSGVTGDPDAIGIAGGSVVDARLADGRREWRFYYTGCPTLGGDLFLCQQKIVCYAVSTDGISWTKRGAVMFRDPERDYADVAVAGPVVWQEDDGAFRMLFSAIGTRWGAYSIGYAESDDGITWRRGDHYGDDLVLGPSGDGWERQMVEYPAVVREADAPRRIFYCGNGYGATGIGTAAPSPLRANATCGPCQLEIVAPEARARWSYRVPEGLNCDEGTFKGHAHPQLDWHGPTADGMLWQEWQTSDEALAVNAANEQARSLGIEFIQGIHYRVAVWPSEHGLDLRFTATNIGARALHNVVGVNCLGQPSEDFRDDELQRTYAVTADGPTPLCRTDRGTGDPCRTHYGVTGQRPLRFYAPAFWGELSQTALTCGAILRTRADGRYTIGTTWERVAEVWDNQDDHGCIHSNFALGDLAPGETKSIRGRIVLVEGDADAALAHLAYEEAQ